MNYAKLTGKPGLPPSWTYGLYMSTSFTTSYDEKTVSGFLEGMKERSCPVHVLHLDCFWMKAVSRNPAPERQGTDKIDDSMTGALLNSTETPFPIRKATFERSRKSTTSKSAYGSTHTSANAQASSKKASTTVTLSSAQTAMSGSGTCGRPEWPLSTLPTLKHASGMRNCCKV